jgi:hypothetical protein
MERMSMNPLRRRAALLLAGPLILTGMLVTTGPATAAVAPTASAQTASTHTTTALAACKWAYHDGDHVVCASDLVFHRSDGAQWNLNRGAHFNIREFHDGGNHCWGYTESGQWGWVNNGWWY